MDRRVQTVLALIDAELGQTLSTDAVAKRVNLSSSRVRHIFAKEMGVPLHRYITARRLDRARQLLRGSFLSVKEVTGQVGFKGAAQFHRNYKRVFAVSPGQDRAGAGGAYDVARIATK